VRKSAASTRNSPEKSQALSSESSMYTAPHEPQSRCTRPLSGETNVATALVGRTSADSGVTVSVIGEAPSRESEHRAAAVEMPRFCNALWPPGTEISYV